VEHEQRVALTVHFGKPVAFVEPHRQAAAVDAETAPWQLGEQRRQQCGADTAAPVPLDDGDPELGRVVVDAAGARVRAPLGSRR